MRKNLSKLIIGIALISAVFILLNINVTTRQGVNYRIRDVKLPLYLKVLDFFDRHYNYKWTVQRIIDNSKTDEEKVLKIFRWTYENIRKAPEGYPIIDDHVWHIIVRGYGTDDQFSDVFTTLCNYAEIEAFFDLVNKNDASSKLTLSFVKINNKWFVFDPYRGVYFKNEKGRLVDIETLKSGKGWEIVTLNRNQEIDYLAFFPNLPLIKNMELGRPSIQTPFKRLIFELNKLKKH